MIFWVDQNQVEVPASFDSSLYKTSSLDLEGGDVNSVDRLVLVGYRL